MKKKTIHTLFILALAILCVSCEPRLDTPSYEAKIAVDGFIEAGKAPIMYLSYSSAFISAYDSLDFVDMVKFNVSAYVITENGDTIGFTRTTASDHYPPFKYTMSPNDLRAEAGKSYQLLIKKNGIEDITATTQIPNEAPTLDSIIFTPTTMDHNYGSYTLRVKNRDESLFFFIQNKEEGEESFYPTKFPCKSNRLFSANEALEFTVQYRRKSNLWEINKSPEEQTETTAPVGSYPADRSMYFKLSSISEGSYKVMSSIFLDTAFPDNPFKPLSQLPESNVSNGIGHWTGLHSKVYVTKAVN